MSTTIDETTAAELAELERKRTDLLAEIRSCLDTITDDVPILSEHDFGIDAGDFTGHADDLIAHGEHLKTLGAHLSELDDEIGCVMNAAGIF